MLVVVKIVVNGHFKAKEKPLKALCFKGFSTGGELGI
jgi:hypothetical protein